MIWESERNWVKEELIKKVYKDGLSVDWCRTHCVNKSSNSGVVTYSVAIRTEDFMVTYNVSGYKETAQFVKEFEANGLQGITYLALRSPSSL